MKEIWTEKKFLTKNNFFKKFVIKYIPYKKYKNNAS